MRKTLWTVQGFNVHPYAKFLQAFTMFENYNFYIYNLKFYFINYLMCPGAK